MVDSSVLVSFLRIFPPATPFPSPPFFLCCFVSVDGRTFPSHPRRAHHFFDDALFPALRRSIRVLTLPTFASPPRLVEN